jgi:hypothetical protein
MGHLAASYCQDNFYITIGNKGQNWQAIDWLID